MDKTPLHIAYAWIDAVNRKDIDRLVQLSSQDIEIRGPRGAVRGSESLRDWLARAGAQFENQRAFQKSGTVVVEQRGIWRSLETGAIVSEASVASRFEVQEGRVIRYQRFDELKTALAAGRLKESDETTNAPRAADYIMTFAKSATDAPEAFGSALPPGLERTNLERARRYLAAIEARRRRKQTDSLAPDEDPLSYLAPDVRQIEYPNQFTPKGAERDLVAIREAAERGLRVIRSERYEVTGSLANGPEVALEVRWVGTLAVSVGSLAAGDDMRGHLGMFLTFRDGLIVRQRNYDCFEPFE